jgi:hypothetical protein
MVKQMLCIAGVVITTLGGLTSSLAQEKPSLPPKAEGKPVAGQAGAETPKQEVAKRRMARLMSTLEAFLKKVESHEHQKAGKDRAPGRPAAGSTTRQTSRTCLICRLKQVDTASAERTTTKYEENECSRWYAAKVEPKHTHVWEDSTCTFVSNADGSPAFVACNPGHYPIWQLSPKTQVAVYQHFKNLTEARDLFLSLADAKTYNDRLDEHDADKGHLIVDALAEWEAADFSGTWKEWWENWYTEHVEERKEYLTWLHSDSHVSFREWKEHKAIREAAAAAAKGTRNGIPSGANGHQ